MSKKSTTSDSSKNGHASQQCQVFQLVWVFGTDTTLIGVVTLGGCFLWLSRMSTLEAIYGHDDIERSDSAWSTTPQAESRAARRKRQRRRS